MSILTTIISHPRPDVVILDVGRKGIGAEFGAPKIKNMPEATIVSFGSEEHLTVTIPNCLLKVGHQLELIPSHGCTTSNLYREFILHRDGKVENIWPIEGSGKLR